MPLLTLQVAKFEAISLNRWMPEDMSDRMPEDSPDRMPEDMPEDMPEHMPEDMPEHMPEDMPDRMPEDMSDRVPEDMPDRMPEDLPDRMPEDMSDRMPSDLPVRECIHAMVGIIRSEVIGLATLELFWHLYLTNLFPPWSTCTPMRFHQVPSFVMTKDENSRKNNESW